MTLWRPPGQGQVDDYYPPPKKKKKFLTEDSVKKLKVGDETADVDR